MKLLVLVLTLATLARSGPYNLRPRGSLAPSTPVCPQPVCVCSESEASEGQPQRQMAKCKEIPAQRMANTFVSLSVVNGYIQQVTKKMTANIGTDLQELDLSSCDMQSIEPGSFDRLTKLVTLKLSDNRLKAVDAGLFKKNAQLRELRLDGNRLSRLEPSLFTKLDRLRELHLERNQLTELPAKVPLGLTHLNVSHNDIGLIPDSTDFNEVQLKELDICGNPLESLTAANLRSFHRLQRLCLGYRSVTLPTGMAELLPHLSRLDLLASPDAPLELTQAGQHELGRVTTLTSLAVVNYHTSSLAFLANLTQLSSLHLDNVTAETIDLQEILASTPHMTHLNLDNSPDLVQHLAASMQLVSQLHNLQVLSMHNSHVTRLQPFEAPNRDLRLDLSGNPLDCDSAWLQEQQSVLLNPQQTVCGAPDNRRGQLLSEVLATLHRPDKREEVAPLPGHNADHGPQHEGDLATPHADWTTQHGDLATHHAAWATHRADEDYYTVDSTHKTIQVATNQATDLRPGHAHRSPHQDEDHAVIYIVLGCILLVLVAIGIVLGIVYWHFKTKKINKVEPQSAEPPAEPTFKQLQSASEDTNLIAD